VQESLRTGAPAAKVNGPTIRLWTVDLDAMGSPAIGPNDAARLRRLARHRALEHVAEQAGVEVVSSCPVCGEEGHGRPVVRGGGDHVSVTWAGRWGLVAFADCLFGIDAEVLRGASRPLTSALSPPEVAALETLSNRDRAETFLRLWTAKEAVAKADGRGLALPLPQLDAAPVVRHGQATVVVDGTRWYVAVLDHEFPDGERAALAIATDCEAPRVIWVPGKEETGHEG
jgi:4'-phosphopantetheinyl transferase